MAVRIPVVVKNSDMLCGIVKRRGRPKEGFDEDSFGMRCAQIESSVDLLPPDRSLVQCAHADRLIDVPVWVLWLNTSVQFGGAFPPNRQHSRRIRTVEKYHTVPRSPTYLAVCN